MKIRKKWLWAALAACGVMAAAVVLLGNLGKKDSGYGMFSWTEEAWAKEEREEFLSVAKRMKVGEVYQEFSLEALEEGEAEEFVGDLKARDIKVYALFGQAEWGYEEDGASLSECILAAAAYNERQEDAGKIYGIMADVEPYLLPEWDGGDRAREQLMDTWLQGMAAAYETAGEHDLELLVCVPTFFDVTSQEALTELVKSACDGIAVMNYNRTDEYGQMEAEIALAEKYGRSVTCIYELQPPGSHDLEEINTYAAAGLPALEASIKAMEAKTQKSHPRAKLNFAYHYYEPLKEILGEEE